MSIAKFEPSKARIRFINMELIEQVKKNRTEAYAHTGESENMIPWNDLSPKERFAAIQAFA